MLVDLERSLARITHSINAEWAIYVKFLASNEEIVMNADARMDTMSIIKLPLLVTLYREHEAGRVDLNQRLTLHTRWKRFGTGILQFLEDGLTFSLHDAATLMIIQSDNTATDICFEAVGGPGRVSEVMHELGLTSIQAVGTTFDWFSALSSSMDTSHARFTPEELFRAGYPRLSPYELAAARERFHFEGNRPFGLASAREIGRLLEMIWKGECAVQASCEDMQQILRRQQYRTRIPKYLFAAEVAHKTGDFDPFIANDVGVIEPFEAPPIIVCFFASRHRGLWVYLEDAIARMGEKVWEYAIYSSAVSGR